MFLLIFRFRVTTVYIIKNGLKLLKEKALEEIHKWGRTEANKAQSQHQGSKKNDDIENASHFK